MTKITVEFDLNDPVGAGKVIEFLQRWYNPPEKRSKVFAGDYPNTLFPPAPPPVSVGGSANTQPFQVDEPLRVEALKDFAAISDPRENILAETIRRIEREPQTEADDWWTPERDLKLVKLHRQRKGMPTIAKVLETTLPRAMGRLGLLLPIRSPAEAAALQTRLEGEIEYLKQGG
jgi:nucleoid-associated protein YgaU